MFTIPVLFLLATTLHDEPTFAGCSMLVYNTVAWSAPQPPLGKDFPETAQTASLKLGADAKAMSMIYDPNTKKLWRSTKSDLAIVLTTTPQELPIVVDGQPRTLLARLRADEPVFAVRGFVVGQTMFETKTIRYLLADANTDGCFHAAGRDRLYLDFDGDGQFDPLVEQYTLGQIIRVVDDRILARASADGKTLTLTRRTADEGTVGFQVVTKDNATVQNVELQLMSEFGEFISLTDLSKDHMLAVGNYQVTRFSFDLLLNRQDVWSYSFYGTKKTFDLEVQTGKPTTYELLPELRMRGYMSHTTPVAPGEFAWVQPIIAAKNGLTLTSAETTMRDEHPGGVRLQAKLMKPGSVEVAKNSGCLQCGSAHRIQLLVPIDTTLDPLEVQVTIPTGPLAGELFQSLDVAIRKKP